MTVLEYLSTELEKLQTQLENGCGNHGCKIKEPAGMAPNGTCNCSEMEFANKLKELWLETRLKIKGW